MGLPVRQRKTMQAAVKRGLDSEGSLALPLNLRRKVYLLYTCSGYKASSSRADWYLPAALAVSEEMRRGVIVTAPTCGLCGIVPAVLYHLQKSREFKAHTRIRPVPCQPD